MIHPDEQATLEAGGIVWNPRFVPPFRPLIHGPYLYALSGRYEWQVEGTLRGTATLRVQTDFGHTVLAERQTTSLPQTLAFELEKPTDKLEIAVSGTADLQSMTVSGMSLRHRL